MAIETPDLGGGFLGGWLAGEDRRQQMLERSRSNAAYNALFDIYGAVAGDPNSNATLAATGRAAELQPYAVRSAGLQNDTAAENLSQSQELRPYIAEKARLGNFNLDLGNQAQRQAIDQSAAAFPLEQQSRILSNTGAGLNNTAQGGANTDAETTRKRAALLSATNMLMSVRDGGGDLAQAFDRLVPTLQSMGIPDGEITQTRSQVISNPQTLDAILSGLTDPVTVAKVAALNARANGTGSGSESEKFYDRNIGKEAAKAEADIYEREGANQRTLTNVKAASADLRLAIGDLLQPEKLKNAFGWNSIGASLYSSRYANAGATLDTLRSKVRLQMISMLKESSKTGATGFGALSDTEGKVLEDALGALNREQSPENAAETLKKALAAIDRIEAKAQTIAADDNANARKKAEELFAKVDKRGGSKAAGYDVDEDAAAGQPEGTILEDENGQRVVVRGGKLVPM